jgi:hypothetical protein
VTHIYIKPSRNQRSTTSREASAAGRLRPNGVLDNWDFRPGQLPCIAVKITWGIGMLRVSSRYLICDSYRHNACWLCAASYSLGL